MKIVLDEKLYSLQEVADLLGVTKPSVSKYVTNDRLQATTIGGKKYVSESHIRIFLNTPDKK